jgi:hypothetical protein
MSGWGLKFFDYDNDGNLDLMIANGFPDDLVEELSHQVTYKEPLLLFRNEGKIFRDVNGQSGPVFSKSFAARGLAIGDFDNDGAVDVLISNNDAAPVLLRNSGQEQSLARRPLDRTQSESRCHRRAGHVPGGRTEARAHESWGREFLVFA